MKSSTKVLLVVVPLLLLIIWILLPFQAKWAISNAIQQVWWSISYRCW
ncbi:MAG: hypothetical protein HYY93_09305 [Planctomycetes bacterium]|nr:hypothetical protein [Planctomycetota bacterium]